MVHMDLRPDCQGSVLGSLSLTVQAWAGYLTSLYLRFFFLGTLITAPAWLEHCEDRCQRSKDGICNVINFG